jgi:hypothetical protein
MVMDYRVIIFQLPGVLDNDYILLSVEASSIENAIEKTRNEFPYAHFIEEYNFFKPKVV